nr:THUMP domain-containing protein [Allomuricauda sp.]
MAGNFRMTAKTFFGLEAVLAQELRNLGAGRVEEGPRIVSFDGDLGFLYKANLCLRTALRILRPVKTFQVRTVNDLYDNVFHLDWLNYFGNDQTFAIDTTMNSRVFKNSMFVSQKAKDALVDKFRHVSGQRPNVDSQNPDIRINIHLFKNTCTVSLDSSGSSLHQRGYRISTNIAPINEVLAAGMLLLSGWDGQSHFLDPMCGSGTILIEAAMIACNIPVNINRKHFAFYNWKDFDEELYEKIRSSSLKKIRPFEHKIFGFDKAPSAVRKAQENIEHANLAEFIELARKDFFRTVKSVDSLLHMVFNPPYGERLTIDADVFYEKIGDTLKQGYSGTNAWFLTSNMEALKQVGLKPSRRIKLFNAKLESRLVHYEMYEGTRKKKEYHETKT